MKVLLVCELVVVAVPAINAGVALRVPLAMPTVAFALLNLVYQFIPTP